MTCSELAHFFFFSPMRENERRKQIKSQVKRLNALMQTGFMMSQVSLPIK
jgi:hypothetical protein